MSKLIFGKKWKKYFVERERDIENKIGTGTIGKGTRVIKDRKINLKEGTILITFESTKIDGSNGKPLKFKMVFANEEDAYIYLSINKGGSKQIFFPDRDSGYVDE